MPEAHPTSPGNARVAEHDRLDLWFEAGRSNRWIALACDPPFTRNSFVECRSVEDLKDRLAFGNWTLGSAFYYQDLCFINQCDGGDEWLTIRHGVAFDSITFRWIIERGEFETMIARLLAATEQQCREGTY
jgi:hypothetical protein